MAFYGEMRDMAADLLKPDSQGGLGQGAISLVRVVVGTPDPLQPQVPVAPVETISTVNQIGNIKAEYVSAGTIVVTDTAYMITPPSFEVKPGDLVRVGGTDKGTVVHVEPFGSLDTLVYVKIFVNY